MNLAPCEHVRVSRLATRELHLNPHGWLRAYSEAGGQIRLKSLSLPHYPPLVCYARFCCHAARRIVLRAFGKQ
jgi:hypothetical protein